MLLLSLEIVDLNLALRLVIYVVIILIFIVKVILHLLLVDDEEWKKQILITMNVTNSIFKAMVPSSVLIGNNLNKNLDHFRSTVEQQLHLLIIVVENVAVLNNGLMDIDLAVSLVSKNRF
jgi:hypothetical protein